MIIKQLVDKEVDKKEWEAKWGHYNSPPPNLIELTESEFAKSDFFVWSWEHTEFRQFKLDDKYGYRSFNLYYMQHGHGYAITNEQGAGKVRYFRFGCQHKWVGLSQSECRQRGITHYSYTYSVCECQHCGELMSYDSGD